MDSVKPSPNPQKSNYTRYCKYTTNQLRYNNPDSHLNSSRQNSPKFNRSTFFSVSSRDSFSFDKTTRENSTDVYRFSQPKTQHLPEMNLISRNSLEARNRTNHFQYDHIKSHSTTSLMKNVRQINSPGQSLKQSNDHRDTSKSQLPELNIPKPGVVRSLSRKDIKNQQLDLKIVSEQKYNRIHNKSSFKISYEIPSKTKGMKASSYKGSDIQSVICNGTSANLCKRYR